VRIRDVNVAAGIHGDASGRVELGAGGGGSIAAVALFAIARNRMDGSGRDIANALIACVGDVNVAAGVDGHGGGIVEHGAGGGGSIAAIACGPVACNCVDDAVADFANAVVVRIRDVNVAVGIDGDAGGRVEHGTGGGGSIAAIALFAVARDGGDHACGGDLANHIVVGVCDVEVAAAVVCDRAGRGKSRAGGSSAVAGVTSGAGAGHRRGGSTGSDPQDGLTIKRRRPRQGKRETGREPAGELAISFAERTCQLLAAHFSGELHACAS